MFKITPVNDRDTARRIADACGVPYREGAFMYRMIDPDGEVLLGMSQFEILGACGMIFDLREAPDRHDFEAMFILGRATMNFIDMCGAHLCRATKDTADAPFLRALGFCEGEDGFTADMHGMFDGHCGVHTVTENGQ